MFESSTKELMKKKSSEFDQEQHDTDVCNWSNAGCIEVRCKDNNLHIAFFCRNKDQNDRTTSDDNTGQAFLRPSGQHRCCRIL